METQKTIHMIDIPAKQIPTFRYAIANRDKVKKILMTTWGGLGDQVCGEPALRYAFTLFKDYEIHLMTSFPDIFQHLPFKGVYHKTNPIIEEIHQNEAEWLVLHTNAPHENLTRDFVQHHFTQCVDFSTICAFQRQLPIIDRHIYLTGSEVSPLSKDKIVIHPGRHWQSKTFPAAWWNDIIAGLNRCYPGQVVVVGKDLDEHTGTVNVTIPDGVKDLRNKQTVLELVGCLKHATVVITNDSAPLHIASAGGAHIIYVASCKEPDYLTHWRFGRWGWRMYNMERDGIWNHKDSIPLRDETYNIDTMDPKILMNLLPLEESVIEQAIQCMKGC